MKTNNFLFLDNLLLLNLIIIFMKRKILIFIITYKAFFEILDLVNKIPIKYLKKHNYAIYASDDASKDNTILYLKKIKKKI